jgi:hypothetical protein
MLSLEQIKLIYQNAPTLSLSKYTSRSKFFPFFLTHLQNFFKLKSKNLYLLEPLLEEDEEQSQVATILVDGELFGQLYYLIDDYSLEVSLFFYSEEFSHKYFLMENEMVEETAIHTYYFWLGALYGIYNSYQEDKQSRKK